MNHRCACLVTLAWLFAPNAFAGCWQVVPEQSQLIFIAGQAGGTLQGRFNDYSGVVCADAANGTASRIEATVQMASVETELPELDEALYGRDFFDAERWPKAIFRGDAVRPVGEDRYQVTGTLQLRDVSREITVPVTLKPDADGSQASLATSLTLARLDYGIGQGEWSDTQWVGDEVTIELTARLVPAPDTAAHGTKH